MVLRRLEYKTRSSNGNSRRAGFTLIEVMIAMIVLVVGLCGLLGLFSLSLARLSGVKDDLIAREKAREIIESIYAARDAGSLTFAQIQNAGTGAGVFVTGYQPMYKAGADGVIGTVDDSVAGLDTYKLPGPDGVLGTADDITETLGAFQRQIAITNLNHLDGTIDVNMRQVEVDIRYTTPLNSQKTYKLVSYVSTFR